MSSYTTDSDGVSTDDVFTVLTDAEANRMSTREVANALDVSHEAAREVLMKLRDDGRVKRIEREKPKSTMWRLVE